MSDHDMDNTIIRNIAQGDTNAFEEIYKNYNKKIFTFSLRYLKNKEDAEGIVQEVFLSIWQNAKKMHIDSNLNAYIFTVTFNAIRKRFRKLSREKAHLKNFASREHEDTEEVTEVEFYDLLEKTRDLIDKLPPQQKKIILLRQEKGLSNPEIADLLHISKKTVENHLNSARTFLKKAMKEKGLLSFLFFWLFVN